VSAVVIDRGELQVEGEVHDYERYAATPTGVSPRAIPGVVGAEQIVNSYEHDAHGWGSPGEAAATRIEQNSKRLHKMQLARTLVPAPREYGPREADVSFILFGSTKMPVREAMRWLEGDGISANMLQLTTVWPFPAHEVFEFIERSKRTIIVEGNATGQLEGIIREFCMREMSHRINRFDGRPFSPEQIYTTTHLILGEFLGAAAPGTAPTEGAS
jgi:2-oxoglutarate ferredoxin oxidoreductase subunit alpha